MFIINSKTGELALSELWVLNHKRKNYFMLEYPISLKFEHHTKENAYVKITS